MRTGLLTATFLALAGCATPAPDDPFVWLRTDGQRLTGNLALTQQAELDKTICSGETQKAVIGVLPSDALTNNIFGQVMLDRQRQEQTGQIVLGCMAGKGYVLVRRSQGEEKLAEFARTAKARSKPKA